MLINDLITLASKRIAEIPMTVGIPVIDEDKGNVSNKLAISMGKCRCAIVVGWNGFQSETTSSKTIIGEAKVVVSVFEKPTVNRADTVSPTALKLAQAIANEINLFVPGPDSAPLVFKRITPLQDLNESTIACDVEFIVKSQL